MPSPRKPTSPPVIPKCPACLGFGGVLNDPDVVCPQCDGTGSVVARTPVAAPTAPSLPAAVQDDTEIPAGVCARCRGRGTTAAWSSGGIVVRVRCIACRWPEIAAGNQSAAMRQPSNMGTAVRYDGEARYGPH